MFGLNEELKEHVKAMEQAEKDVKKKQRGRKRAAAVDDELNPKDRENESRGDWGKESEEQPKKKARAKKVKDGSGPQNCRVQGTSNYKITQLGDKAMKGSQITPATGSWSDADRLIVIKLSTSAQRRSGQTSRSLRQRNAFLYHRTFLATNETSSRCTIAGIMCGHFTRHMQTDNEGLGNDKSDDEGEGGLPPRKPLKHSLKCQMDTFKGTEFYNRIDVVAYGPHAFGLTNPISDAEEDEKPKKPLRGRKQAPKGSNNKSGAVLKDLLGTYKLCVLNRENLEEEKLKLDQGLLELVKQKEKHQARFSKAGAWEQIM
ncbi:hypothetical protein FIBSPDRAFT_887198 [Athelia psychrophila]|uniref:Uncharacterized protein n=1 Tax=Athelia psychrophila TaxID=1759441 RepID=A0A166Q3G3_9AGAM|nr:hypothetical protein FIBSPDRAFT_887198 [Fibularhizoctonia sp. CBS 109695]